ncbi:unnamed protein product [Adineta ricciae]|uniref:EamA domain-containing protein n=1 Tax=Adineta ricciae TaxID=249248 RepID=A0A816E2F8_ADIRI|nr:unnamed protein product [Adineta ricciae]CAF1640527.1 unnamed protein product [Adineta ricciae]
MSLVREDVLCEKQYEDSSLSAKIPNDPSIFLPPAISTLSINDPLVDKISFSRQFSGVFYTLISSLLFTCATFSIKQLGIDLLDALLLRFILQTLGTFSYVRYKHYPIFLGNPTQILLQLLCCATGAMGLFLFFIAVRYVELSDVTTLSYTRVVWTVVFSMILYRERPTWSTLTALPLTLLGVVCVAQPTFLFASKVVSTDSKYRFLGLALSITTAFTGTTNVLTYKQLVCTSKDIKPSVINFQYCFTTLILLFINQIYKKYILHTGLTWSILLSCRFILTSIISLAIILVNIFTQKAIKREHPAVYSLLTSADIIFALILQNIFTPKRSNSFALLGSALVIISVLIIGLNKIINERSSHKRIKLIDTKVIAKDFEDKTEKC